MDCQAANFSQMSGRLALPIVFPEPYLLAGIGAYFAKSEIGGLGKDSIDFGYSGGGELTFNPGKCYFIDAEAKYLVLKVPALTVTPYGTISQGSIGIDGALGAGNFGFRF